MLRFVFIFSLLFLVAHSFHQLPFPSVRKTQAIGYTLPRSNLSSPFALPLRMSKKDIELVNSQPHRQNANTYWVTNTLIAGEYPTDKMGEEPSRLKLQHYLKLGINCFIDLTREGEKTCYEEMLKQEAEKLGFEVLYQRFPVQDFGIPTVDGMKLILDNIDHAIAAKRKVYVHCRGGIGRTGTIIGCYLARHGCEGEEALMNVNRLFQNSNRSCESSCSPETGAQMDMVRRWKG